MALMLPSVGRHDACRQLRPLPPGVGPRPGRDLRAHRRARGQHDGEYALVGSQGGRPKDPVWVHNLRADPTAVMVQYGPEQWDAEVREVTGEERDLWWERAVAAYPPYDDYQAATDRSIPV